MNDFSGPDRSHQLDLSSFVPSSRYRFEIPSSFSEAVHSGVVQHYRDRPILHSTYEDGSGCPRVDESLQEDEYNSYRLYCPISCDPSPSMPQYSSIPYHDYLLPESGPYHFMNPPPGVCKNSPHPLTPEETFAYGMSSAEACEAVASISSEAADDACLQTCPRHESARELRQCNQLDMGQNAVNRGGQMVVLNHCSPSQSQMLHPMILGHSVSSPEPLLYTAEHTRSPEHCLTLGRGDSVPVNQVQGGFSSQPYLSSLSRPHPSSNLLSSAPSYSFNIMPGSYMSQFHQAACTAPPDKVEMEASRVQSVCVWERSKKPCNCTKSQCLKLYCDCFANGEICSNCNCVNCCNNKEHESERSRAIKACLDKNPGAFRPKIGSRKVGDVKNRHTKGCNCRRSGCLKNYCECYEAKIMCSSTCKCIGCRNYDGSPVRERMACDSPDTTSSLYSTSLQNSQCPLSCITPDVVEATCGCLLAQAEEAEKEGHTRPQAERMILEEFGQCLTQIVRSIFKSTGVQW